ncbi:hypothetical protein ACWD4G_08635 [Streptomyces sp. NPDC002643]
MGQRLGIASALLGDPAIVMLDEPVNGLDPEGVLWVRNLLRALADEGRAVMRCEGRHRRDREAAFAAGRSRCHHQLLLRR